MTFTASACAVTVDIVGHVLFYLLTYLLTYLLLFPRSQNAWLYALKISDEKRPMRADIAVQVSYHS